MIENNEPSYHNRDNEPVVDLIKKLIEKDPQKRISLEQTLLHEWLISTNVDTFDQNSKTVYSIIYNKNSQMKSDINNGSSNNKKIITSLELGDSEDEAEDVETGENKENTLKTEDSHHDIVLPPIGNSWDVVSPPTN